MKGKGGWHQGRLFPQCPGRALGEHALSLLKCRSFVPPMPWQGIGGTSALGVLSLSKGRDPLFPECPGRALGIQRALWFCVPNAWQSIGETQGPLGSIHFEALFPQHPGRALGEQRAPWSLFCWQLTSDQLVPACLC